MTFRYARHTNDLIALQKFYIQVLGFELLGRFQDHDGYDGIFLGPRDGSWHLEFTTNGQPVEHRFGPDDALVFYPDTMQAYQSILQAIRVHDLPFVQPPNPYWQINGTAVKDPDGCMVIISPQRMREE